MKLWIRVALDHQQEKDSEKAHVKQYFEAEVELEVLLHGAVLINDQCVHATVATRWKERGQGHAKDPKHHAEEG